jgi:hypothetical protein
MNICIFDKISDGLTFSQNGLTFSQNGLTFSSNGLTFCPFCNFVILNSNLKILLCKQFIVFINCIKKRFLFRAFLLPQIQNLIT